MVLQDNRLIFDTGPADELQRVMGQPGLLAKRRPIRSARMRALRLVTRAQLSYSLPQQPLESERCTGWVSRSS